MSDGPEVLPDVIFCAAICRVWPTVLEVCILGNAAPVRAACEQYEPLEYLVMRCNKEHILGPDSYPNNLRMFTDARRQSNYFC